MSDVALVRARLLEALSRISEGRESTTDLTCLIRRAVLEFASETPDNVNCAERIEVGVIDDAAALKIEGQSVLLSDIAHAIEDEPMPEALKATYPELTQADWDAFTRMTTLLYVLLRRPS